MRLAAPLARHLGVPRHDGVRDDQRPDHRHKEVLGRGLLLVREAQLWELPQLVAAPCAQALCTQPCSSLGNVKHKKGWSGHGCQLDYACCIVRYN